MRSNANMRNLPHPLDTGGECGRLDRTQHTWEMHMVRKYRGEWVIVVAQFDGSYTSVRFEEDRFNRVMLVKTAELV